MPTWETKTRLSGGSIPLIRSTIGCWWVRRLTSHSIPYVPTHGLLNWCGRWGCRSSEGHPSFPHPLERRRSRHPHPEESQSRVREVAVRKKPSSSFLPIVDVNRRLHSEPRSNSVIAMLRQQ